MGLRRPRATDSEKGNTLRTVLAILAVAASVGFGLEAPTPRLLGDIARVAAHTARSAVRTITGERDLAVGIVACLQTHGSRAHRHPLTASPAV